MACHLVQTYNMLVNNNVHIVKWKETSMEERDSRQSSEENPLLASVSAGISLHSRGARPHPVMTWVSTCCPTFHFFPWLPQPHAFEEMRAFSSKVRAWMSAALWLATWPWFSDVLSAKQSAATHSEGYPHNPYFPSHTYTWKHVLCAETIRGRRQRRRREA